MGAVAGSVGRGGEGAGRHSRGGTACEVLGGGQGRAGEDESSQAPGRADHCIPRRLQGCHGLLCARHHTSPHHSTKGAFTAHRTLLACMYESMARVSPFPLAVPPPPPRPLAAPFRPRPSGCTLARASLCMSWPTRCSTWQSQTSRHWQCAKRTRCLPGERGTGRGGGMGGVAVVRPCRVGAKCVGAANWGTVRRAAWWWCLGRRGRCCPSCTALHCTAPPPFCLLAFHPVLPPLPPSP